AEDGIRALTVTGVQTCALPISPLKTLTVSPIPGAFGQGFPGLLYLSTLAYLNTSDLPMPMRTESQKRFLSELLQAHETAHQWWRSEERRVGKECRSRG